MALARPHLHAADRTVRVLDRNDSHRFCIRAACLTITDSAATRRCLLQWPCQPLLFIFQLDLRR